MQLQRGVIIRDGLWRSLCPSFDRCLVHHSPQPESSTRLHTTPPLRPRPPAQSATRTVVLGRRYYSYVADSADILLKETMFARKEKVGRSSLADILGAVNPAVDQQLYRYSVDDIFKRLEIVRGLRKSLNFSMPAEPHKYVVELVQHLIRARSQRLTPFLYECLAASMVNPLSTCTNMIKLVRDMAQQGVEPTREFYDIAIQSFTVHPNYVGLLEVLDLLKAREWPRKSAILAVALLRDEQYELAYYTLVEMHTAKLRIAPWVYDVFILVFGKMGFLDEMLEMLALRLDLNYLKGPQLAIGIENLQLYAMDVCSQAFHYPGTIAGWNMLVRSDRVRPADGILENVLDTAAREGDATLAAEALDMLARRMRPRDYHYESLAEAMTQAGDLDGVVRMYCIMHENGKSVSRHTADHFLEVAGAGVIGAEINARISCVRDEGKLIPPTVVHAVLARHLATACYPFLMKLLDDHERLCGYSCPPHEILSLLSSCEDLSCLNTLCDRFLDAAQGTDDGLALMDQYRAVATKLSEDGKQLRSDVIVKKLVERGLDAGVDEQLRGLRRP